MLLGLSVVVSQAYLGYGVGMVIGLIILGFVKRGVKRSIARKRARKEERKREEEERKREVLGPYYDLYQKLNHGTATLHVIIIAAIRQFIKEQQKTGTTLPLSVGGLQIFAKIFQNNTEWQKECVNLLIPFLKT